MNGSDNIPLNLCVLLWNRQVAKDQWVDELSRWCQCDRTRAARLLSGKVKPNDDEVQLIVRQTGIEPEQLVYENLVDNLNVFAENIKFLLDTLKHGEQNHLAAILNVSVGSVRKWKSGAQPPNKGHQVKILRFFRLPDYTELNRTPLFLSLDPIGVHAKREWILDRLRQIDDDQFDQYFPAFKKLLD